MGKTLKAGAICKISVRNFVTHTDVSLEPGPNLNMLIGPNGTGKSTIVAAIILGLGGSPKTIGRGSKISEYVKHECTEATIEIILQGNTSDEFIHITRHFDIHDKTIWTLNGKKVMFRDIEATIKLFNIQVDNLCQFLPQDRVQDFAKMNKQQLLQQTQIAICRHDLIDKQLNLIKIRERHKELQTSIEKYSQKLQELHDANVRVEGKVKNLKKKKKYLKYIEDVDRKVAWVRYENLRSKMEDIKADKVKAAEVYNRHKDAAKPIENAIVNAKKIIAGTQRKATDMGQEVRSYEIAVQNKINAYSKMKGAMMKGLGDLDSRLREIERRDQEIAEATQQINALTQNKTQLLEMHGDDEQRQEKIRICNENLKKLSAHISKIVGKKGDLDNIKLNKNYELRSFENELAKLENVRQQRLEWLRRMDKDAYAAVQWLRSNKQMFKGEVFEPMMLELNVLNPQHAIFIENVIPVRDRIAFTCVLKEDMNLLIRMLRDQQKLSVNVVHSGNDQPGFLSYQPTIPIEQLKPYGMFAYIHSLVTGPEPIMKYLCRTFQIHNTPVGGSLTNKKFENVPAQITNFFSDTFRFSTSYSKYTGQKSTRQNEIRSDGSLAISLDAQRMESIRGQLAEVQSDYQKFDDQIRTLDMQIAQLTDKQNTLRDSLRELQKCKQDIQGIDSRIRVVGNKLQQLKQDTIGREQLQNECDERVKKIVQKMVECQNEIKEAFGKYSDVFNQSELEKTNLDTARKQVTFLENKALDVRRLCEEAEETVRRIKEAYTNATNDAKMALSTAKQLSKGFTPTDTGFDEFKEAYDSLADDLQELEAEKEHILSKIDCLNTADVGELQDYEQRQVQIVKLQEDIQEGNVELDEINSNLDTLQREWFEPLQEVVTEINVRFSAAFKRMGCAGEVCVFKGENDKDFAEYGLSIKVKYRDAEPLQELNNIVQSGGERAVATAAFMLSLQELTPVPFRCVDEINQGMDSNNERRIFELLVKATSQPDTAQYFFITPKLVPHLKFVPTMAIHIIHNGPFVPSQKQWNGVLASAKQAIAAL